MNFKILCRSFEAPTKPYQIKQTESKSAKKWQRRSKFKHFESGRTDTHTHTHVRSPFHSPPHELRSAGFYKQSLSLKKPCHFVVKISYCHKRPCNANTNFRDNRIWKLDHFQSARIVYYHFELMINILLRDRRCSVLSCCVCIISYWWGKFEIQWKSLGACISCK